MDKNYLKKIEHDMILLCSVFSKVKKKAHFFQLKRELGQMHIINVVIRTQKV